MKIVFFFRDNRPVTGTSIASSQLSEKEDERTDPKDETTEKSVKGNAIENSEDVLPSEKPKETKVPLPSSEKTPRQASLLLVGPKGAVRY